MNPFFLALLQTAGGGSTVATPYQFERLIVPGDSNGVGDNGNGFDPQNRWTYYVSSELGVVEDNHSISGRLLCNNTVNSVPSGVAVYQDYIQANSKYALPLGTNDLNNGIALELFAAIYEQVVLTLSFSYRPQDIILCDIPWTAEAGYQSWSLARHLAFNKVIEDLAIKYGTRFCSFYAATFERRELYISDMLHFKPTGQRVLADTFLAAL